MAEAAIETADWTRKTVKWAERQFYATVGEIIALVATIAIAILAVAAAFGSNRIARESAERQLRAYVSVSACNIVMADNGGVTSKIKFRNSGQTPAYNVIPNVNLSATPYPVREGFFKEPIMPERVSRATIGSGGIVERDMILPRLLAQDWRDFIAASKGVFFVHGVVRYSDIFGKPHTTHFRLIYMGPWGGQCALEVYKEGNEAD
jgi:hypothetical protein